MLQFWLRQLRLKLQAQLSLSKGPSLQVWGSSSRSAQAILNCKADTGQVGRPRLLRAWLVLADARLFSILAVVTQ